MGNPRFNPRLKPGEKIEDKKDEFYHFRTLRSASRNSIPFDFDFNMTTGFRIVLAQTVSSDTLRVKEGKLE